MYSGPELPIEEVCILYKASGIYIMSLDGATAQKGPLFGTDWKLIELKPGEHTLLIGVSRTDYYGGSRSATYKSTEDIKLRFFGKPGRVYSIGPDFRTAYWSPEIVDITNSEVGQRALSYMEKHRH
jgi:hypothetical protein